MKNFIIGQHGFFNKNKYESDFRKEFWGIEACLLKAEDDINILNEFKYKDNYNVGIHFPLRSGQWEHRDPQYLSNDENIRKESYEYMEKEIEYAKIVNPEYILFHYPKPVLLDDRVDWHGWKWRFADKSEYFFDSECELNAFIERSKFFFNWLSKKAKQDSFTPIIELDAIPRCLYETSLLTDLLREFSDIRVCVDIGRLHLQHKIDDHFDSFEFLESIIEFVSEVHLWNLQITDEVKHSHFPALPTLKPEDGWADVNRYFEILRLSDEDLKILFEHNSDLISESELDDCYKWIESIAK